MVDAESAAISMNENVWIEILTRRSFPHLNEVFRVYKDITQMDIETAIENDLSGSLKISFLGFFWYKLYLKNCGNFFL